MAHLEISAIVPGPRSEVFEVVCAPEKLALLLADRIDVQMTRSAEALRRGAEYEFLMTRFGFSQPVRLKVEDYLKGSRLTYRQSEGLFADWVHTIKLEDHGENQTLVTDYVDYKVPFGLVGYLADDLFVRRDMRQILANRLNQAKAIFTKKN
ncbi:MAG: hypothetical protein AB7N80_10890 [Bdellovibrionales bacterium]